MLDVDVVKCSSKPASVTGRGEQQPSNVWAYSIGKRGIDVLLILACAPVLCPLFVVIALLVSIDSPGPILFGHRRIRGRGDFFTVWKFRTMCADASEVLEDYLASNPEARLEWEQSHKLKNDPRVTDIGRFMRRTSLDELPQLWNVINGTMSLVGPRPITDAEIAKYGKAFDTYCKVKPGLAGLWQMSGRNDSSYTRRIQLDCDYVDKWSISRDIVILVGTLWAVLNGYGAY